MILIGAFLSGGEAGIVFIQVPLEDEGLTVMEDQTV